MSKPFTASNIPLNEYHEQIKCGIDLSVSRSFVMILKKKVMYNYVNSNNIGCFYMFPKMLHNIYVFQQLNVALITLKMHPLQR